MTGAHRAWAAVALVGALVLAGCGQEDDDDLPQDIFGTTSTTPPSADEVAREAARTRVYEWVSGRNTIMANPDGYRDITTIGFAEAGEANDLVADAAKLGLKDRHLEGSAKLTHDPSVTKVDLDPPDHKGQQVSPFVDLTACLDESGTHVVDASGAKVPGTTGKGPHPVKFRVINRTYPDAATWRVASHEVGKGSC